MFTLKNSLIGLLLILSIGLSSWSILIGKKSQALAPTNSSTEPDAYMEEVIAIILNKQGAPSMKIETPKMVHYAENDVTDISKPHITVYRQSPEPWYINSTFAKAKDGIDQILFWDNVIIHHAEDSANPTTTMTTTSLTVFPNQQLAKTDQSITVTQPNATLHAVGMLANMNDGTVKLLSNARGEYVPS
ncbi:MAG: LPS export ABC transporter periplasmic protein LptC [Gammaproteobacteria bacterium]|nr:LPS export ABC transporter periplasmic protein LptC [Gammaproteobacteria bacterium]